MSMQNAVIEGALVVAVLGWIIYRQSQWRPLDAARMWRAPVVIAVIGLVQMKTAVTGSIGVVAVALLVLSAVLSLAVGVAMGWLSQIRETDGRLWARTGLLGSALWFVLLAVRIGVDVWAHMLGATIVTAVGVILIMLALNRAGRTLVLTWRAEQLRPIGAH
ncbi:hypothetical protein [Nocardia pseudobrasiliensis]|uniref:DUF1453 family protein n=1 Tax=Nocardia pseudobrasiliensis TaxID=45979 RepID=A0A370ID06_9NOCA|nr:hypothetical protein [Nocardia pseudobrasiliensis]RDI68593.1 hypothetical protein DFR76_101128 [Nocardia pseudobrasiliensis]